MYFIQAAVLAAIIVFSPIQSAAEEIRVASNTMSSGDNIAPVSVLPAPGPVDMLLCLAADVSESVTTDEYRLQKQGHASAIKDPQVIAAIQQGIHGRIAAIYVEWAKQDQQFVGVDWHVIDGESSAGDFARKISASPMPPWIAARVRNTSTSEAVRFCVRQFNAAPVKSTRRVIDISSDGTSNIGADISLVRDEAVGQGVVINALAIV